MRNVTKKDIDKLERTGEMINGRRWLKSRAHLPCNKAFLLIKKNTKNIKALQSMTKQRLQVTLHHSSSLRSDAQRLRRHPNNVGARRSEICPVTANKLLTAAMNRLASSTSTGMQASDSSSQTRAEEPLIVCLILQRGTHCLGEHHCFIFNRILTKKKTK